MVPSSLDATTRSVALTVLRHGPISRAEVARQLELSSASLTRITRTLIEHRIIEQGEPMATSAGRPSVPLRIVDGTATFLGFKIVPGHCYVVATGLNAAVRERSEHDLDTSSFEATTRGIAELVSAHAGVVGVGVCLPAAVEANGTLHATRMLGWPGGANLERRVTDLTGLPCSSANDIDGLALHLQWFGPGRGCANFVAVTFGLGVGVGAIVDDRVLLGAQGAASILGRLWLPDGRLFSDVLSIATVERRASELVGHEVAFAEALSCPQVTPVVDDTRRALGSLARAAAIAYAPERIVLTGEGIELLGGSTDMVAEEVARDWRDDLRVPELAIRPIDFHDYARGAVALAIQRRLAA